MRALLLVIERRFDDDDDDDDAAASEMGELFSTTKAKSLSLFLSSTKHPTARMREELLLRFTRMKKPLSDLSLLLLLLLLRKSAFERAQVLLYSLL